MTDFNIAAGGAALMLAAAFFISVCCVGMTWAMIFEYCWLYAIQVWGGILGTVLVIFAIFLIGGSIGCCNDVQIVPFLFDAKHPPPDSV